MRQGHQNRRSRGRSRKGQNPLTRSFESNGPDVKIRGTPAHIAEKYMSLARDASTSDDPVLAENYLQHAEHYNRIIMAFREQQVQQTGGGEMVQGASRFGNPIGPDEDFEPFPADEALNLTDYYVATGAQLDFLCDEAFWGQPPEEVIADAELLCDQEAFDEFLSNALGSDDFSDDLTSDFSDDFSDDVGAEEFIGPIAVGENATGFIEPQGADVYEIDGTGGDARQRRRRAIGDGERKFCRSLSARGNRHRPATVVGRRNLGRSHQRHHAQHEGERGQQQGGADRRHARAA